MKGHVLVELMFRKDWIDDEIKLGVLARRKKLERKIRRGR